MLADRKRLLYITHLKTMSNMSHPQFRPAITCPTSHDTIKSLRGQLEIIQVYIDHFFTTVKDPSLRDLFPRTIPFSSFPGSIIPENMDIIDCQTDHLPQPTLSAIRIALSHLMIERLKSVFKLILLASQTGREDHMESVSSLATADAGDLIYIALIRILKCQLFNSNANGPGMMPFRETAVKINNGKVVRRPRRPPSRKMGAVPETAKSNLLGPDSPTYNRSSQEKTPRPERTQDKKLAFHKSALLRSRTRTVHSRARVAPSTSSIDRIKHLEGEIETLRKNELLLLTYPDPYGPCSTRPSGEAMLDMKMQIAANQLRIHLLNKQTGHLALTLEQMSQPEFRGERDVNFIASSMSSHCVNNGASCCAGDNERKSQAYPDNFAKLPPRTLLTVTASDRVKSDGHNTTSTPRQSTAVKSVNEAGKKAPDQPRTMTSLAKKPGTGREYSEPLDRSSARQKGSRKLFSNNTANTKVATNSVPVMSLRVSSRLSTAESRSSLAQWK